MINVSIEYELNKTFIVLNSEELVGKRDYRHTVISENNIAGTLPLFERIIDQKKYFYADITGKETVLHYYMVKGASYKEICELFKAIKMVSNRLEEFFVDSDNILIRPELIYRNALTGEYELIVAPFSEICEENSLKTLLGFIVSKAEEDTGKIGYIEELLYLYENCDSVNIPIGSIYERLVLLNIPEDIEEDYLISHDAITIKPPSYIREIITASAFSLGALLLLWGVCFY